jgi:hypothetical protein
MHGILRTRSSRSLRTWKNMKKTMNAAPATPANPRTRMVSKIDTVMTTGAAQSHCEVNSPCGRESE